MKKWWIFIVIAVVVISATVVVTAIAKNSEKGTSIDENGKVSFEVDDSIKTAQLPEEDLKKSTAELLDIVLSDPGMIMMERADSNLQRNNFESWKRNYNGIAELAAREDAAEAVYNRYAELFPDGIDRSLLYSGTNRIVLCMLFSDDIYSGLTEAQKAAVGDTPFE